MAQTAQITKTISLFIRVEGSKRFDMVNIHLFVKLALSYSAMLAREIIPLSYFISLRTPIWTSIVSMTTSPMGMLLSSKVATTPLRSAYGRAESLLLSKGISEGLTTLKAGCISATIAIPAG